MPCLRKWVAGRTRRRIERQKIRIKEKIEGQQNRSTDKKVFATKLDNLSLVPCGSCSLTSTGTRSNDNKSSSNKRKKLN